MMLDISQALRAPGEAIPFVHQEPLLDLDILGDQVAFPEPAVLQGTFSLADEALVIKGRLTAQAHAHCARCLNPVVHQVQVPFTESFLREDPRNQVEEDPWEERQVFTGHTVDLAPLAMTLATLDLPMRFLCGANCAGIQEAPGGTPPSQEETLDDAHPFGALKQLFTKFQEE